MSLYPENPAGQVQLVSQDTYASANLPLSVVGSGGGGGGPVPANLSVSTLKVNEQLYLGTLATAILSYADATSTLTVDAPAVGISSLVGVSTINGQAVAAFTGAIPPDLALSTLSVGGSGTSGGGVGSLTITTFQDSPERSNKILFNSLGNDTVDAGVLQVYKGVIGDFNGSTINGLRVGSYSTIFGAAQPVIVGSVLVAGEDNDGDNEAATISYTQPSSTLTITAPAVGISSLVGVSSINGINWNAISTLVG